MDILIATLMVLQLVVTIYGIYRATKS